MNHQHRVRLFDDWAERYDQSIQDDVSFPFDGYEQVLDEITRAAGARCGMKVLDLGVGTGNLAARFAALGRDIWGIDFSAEMLAKAIEKLPQAVLVQADLLRDWPTELDHRFDRIVSAYVLHEFDLATKVKLLQGLTERHLAAKGRIVVGDIAFATFGARDQARRKWACGMKRSTTGQRMRWRIPARVPDCKSGTTRFRVVVVFLSSSLLIQGRRAD